MNCKHVPSVAKNYKHEPTLEVREIRELVRLLRKENIDFEDISQYGHKPPNRLEAYNYHIVIPNWKTWKGERKGISIVCNELSMGGDKGLLEIWRRTDKVYDKDTIGYLRAGEAFKLIKEAL